jgi:hypothetical protein
LTEDLEVIGRVKPYHYGLEQQKYLGEVSRILTQIEKEKLSHGASPDSCNPNCYALEYVSKIIKATRRVAGLTLIGRTAADLGIPGLKTVIRSSMPAAGLRLLQAEGLDASILLIWMEAIWIADQDGTKARYLGLRKSSYRRKTD